MAERICTIDGCGRRRKSSQYCQPHYSRFKRYGSPLAGPTSPGAHAKFLDEAMSFTGDDCLYWPFGGADNGYAQMAYKGHKRTCGRIICERLYGPAPSPVHQAAHSCGNGHLGCVSPKHVRWATPKENAADKYLHGTNPSPATNTASPLSEAQVREIIRIIETEPASDRGLGRRFGVANTTIKRIRLGKSWTHIPRNQTNSDGRHSARSSFCRHTPSPAARRAELLENQTPVRAAPRIHGATR